MAAKPQLMPLQNRPVILIRRLGELLNSPPEARGREIGDDPPAAS